MPLSTPLYLATHYIQPQNQSSTIHPSADNREGQSFLADTDTSKSISNLSPWGSWELTCQPLQGWGRTQGTWHGLPPGPRLCLACDSSVDTWQSTHDTTETIGGWCNVEMARGRLTVRVAIHFMSVCSRNQCRINSLSVLFHLPQHAIEDVTKHSPLRAPRLHRWRGSRESAHLHRDE